MIDDGDDFVGLEGLEPEQKFYKIELTARRKFEQAQYVARERGIDTDYVDYRNYMNLVLGAADACGIDELVGYQFPRLSDNDWLEVVHMFHAQAARVSNRIRFSTDARRESVALDAATKTKISHWLAQMREAVQQADVSPDKKDRLFGLINKLQAEVDRERTPLHAAGETWQTVCTYAAEGAKTLEPVVQLLERVGGALGIAKQKEETQPKLPPRQEPKRIENKNNGLARRADIDDEIPF